MKAYRLSPMMGWILLLVLPLSVAAQNIEVTPIIFAPGTSSATVKGAISGYQVVDYTLRARAGQTMKIALQTGHGSNYFNLLPPGSEAALANGSVSGNEWSGTLPVDGEYRVRVYMMRSAARRNETAHYTLTVGITGSADAKVAGSPYHATGMVPCSIGTDPKASAQCSFGVIRSAPGRAEVHLASPGFDVRLHKEDLRVLKFSDGAVTCTDPQARVTSEKQGDGWSIGVNDFYFYLIPEAMISGG